MDEKRQKTEEGCPADTWSEAPELEATAIEAAMADSQEEGSATDLMEEILERENIKAAIIKVRANRGAPGVDGMTVEDLVPYLMANWGRLRKELLEGKYKPKPVKRVEIPKPGGGKRALGIPTVVDRMVQQAFLQVLQPRWDPTFSDQSYGFRPGRSQHHAIKAARELIQGGCEYVVDIDLEKFFDRVNHDVLMARVARRVKDKRVLRTIRAFLNAGILAEGLAIPAAEGVPQGGPLSPLLSNLLLDDLDKELEKRGLQFVRYADDCNIYVRSERAGTRVKESITKFLASKLRLKVNEGKSAVGKPSTRTFLGFTFGGARDVPRLIAMKSIQRARAKIKELARSGKHTSLENTTRAVGKYLRQWLGYFGITDRVSDVQSIFGYARRRMRCLAWVQWKTPRRRRQKLTELGVKPGTAYAVSYSSKGSWRLSASPSLQQALDKDYFRARSFPASLNGQGL